MKIFQKGFNFSQDGPGNRLVYHTAGCNMSCLWCANPEGMTAKNDHKSYTPDEIVAEAESCRMMFFEGGGVTFTGGEATLNADELIEVLKKLKERGIHTAIETNGTSERLPEILEYTDYLMMDFKHYDGELLKKYTGLDGSIIKENYKKIAESGRQCHIRIPLINEFNGAYAEGFAEFLSSVDTSNIVFEFLRYHEYGKDKWQTEYKIKDGYVTDETVKKFTDEFNKQGLTCVRT